MMCNCAGTAPGYPQHETYCGQDEFTEFDGEPSWLEEVADVMAPIAYWRLVDYMAGTR